MADYPTSLALIGAARERGLSCNTEMLRFAHGLGFEVQHVPDDITTVRIVKTLQPSRPQRPEHHASSATVPEKESRAC